MVELPSFPSFEWDFLVIDTPKGGDLILGFDFLNHFSPSIDWRQGLITFNSDHMDSCDPSNSFRNDFSSAKSCATLLGDSRTPSFPSSVYIPSINSPQSLLSSRDEVFKEIKDVGEDNSVSSLHLFCGNMDLPPSSYHDSLEELWDEEEEPEEVRTVIKVVSSIYHQYFDVFSKVKTEKPPPHRSCDHHIELEASLPPVSVIYSFSNQESDMLRAYISENVEKGFIQPSSSSTGAPVLFVKKKDGGLRLCVDYCKLNAVTRKNKYPVPCMNKLLNVFNGSSIFSKIDLQGAYNLLRIKEGDEYLTASTTRYGSYEYLATLPDALSYWDDVYPEREEDFIRKNPMNFQQLIKQDKVQTSRYFAVKVEYFSDLIDSIQKPLWQDFQYRSILQELGKGKSVQDYCIDSSSQPLSFKDQVVVPNDPKIQLRIPQKCHDSPLTEHPGQENTLKLVKWDFHWSSVTQFIKDYFPSCQQCSRNKNIHEKKFGFLKPLQIPNGPWIWLSIGFITQLPLSNSFDSILVIVDRFSKMEQLKISRALSTAYNPETDRQTERVNQILEQFLYMYVSYHQDDWNTWLHLAEFSYNNSDHSSTTQSPFFTVYGRDQQFDSAHIAQDTPDGNLSRKIQSVKQYVKRELEVAINMFKRYADKSRASLPVFNPGDMVWLSFKNIKSTRPTKKLSERWLVFHISLLEPVKTSTIPNRHQEPPPPIIIEEEEEWAVSQIMHSKLRRRKLWYLVEWKGFSQDPERFTWEPAKTSRIALNLSRISILYIPTSQAPVLQRA
ncbi:hypothetical protein O181_009682 [Austropuccinia psidii MF-1]|uniref:Chromo domain-containing protein n=1 Tax=Austropuccinia psidii MF-1 TaxID=1389203 RepID=A0A9Q3BS90_9BASI|nr:hypothetical protein [Austropuccinia psidii MF-1]